MNRIINSAIGKITNAYTMSRQLLSQTMYGGNRDIDKVMGYPQRTIDAYWELYKTNGIANRIISLYPEECFRTSPCVYDTDDTDEETEFEAAYKALDDEFNLNSFYLRADKISGIGKYGVIFLGLDDVQRPEDISLPVQSGERRLLFIEIKSQKSASIADYDRNPKSPRYGLPEYYNIIMNIEESEEITRDADTKSQTQKGARVHWSRVVHIADNRDESNIFGAPRLEMLFDRVYDLKKLPGASAEAYWQNVTGQTYFSQDLDSEPLTSDEKEAIKNDLEEFVNSMRKSIILQGMTPNRLSVQITDPKEHALLQYQQIAIALGCPMRVLMGSEQGQLASGQDAANWCGRIEGRRNEYLTPFVIGAFVKHLQMIDVLPECKESLKVEWPPINDEGPEVKARVAETITKALSAYAQGGIDMILPLNFYLENIIGMSKSQIEAAEEMLAESMTDSRIEDISEDESEEEYSKNV